MWKVIHLPTSQVIQVGGQDYAVDKKEVAQLFINMFHFVDYNGKVSMRLNKPSGWSLSRGMIELQRCEFFYI